MGRTTAFTLCACATTYDPDSETAFCAAGVDGTDDPCSSEDTRCGSLTFEWSCSGGSGSGSGSGANATAAACDGLLPPTVDACRWTVPAGGDVEYPNPNPNPNPSLNPNPNPNPNSNPNPNLTLTRTVNR